MPSPRWLEMQAKLEGFIEIREAYKARVRALQPSGALGKAIQFMTLLAHREIVNYTPVDTYSWKASTLLEVDLEKLTGIVFVSPSNKNVKSGKRVIEYALEWEYGQSGYRRVYYETARDQGERILKAGEYIVLRAIRES